MGACGQQRQHHCSQQRRSRGLGRLLIVAPRRCGGGCRRSSSCVAPAVPTGKRQRQHQRAPRPRHGQRCSTLQGRASSSLTSARGCHCRAACWASPAWRPSRLACLRGPTPGLRAAPWPVAGARPRARPPRPTCSSSTRPPWRPAAPTEPPRGCRVAGASPGAGAPPVHP